MDSSRTCASTSAGIFALSSSESRRRDVIARVVRTRARERSEGMLKLIPCKHFGNGLTGGTGKKVGFSAGRARLLFSNATLSSHLSKLRNLSWKTGRAKLSSWRARIRPATQGLGSFAPCFWCGIGRIAFDHRVGV